MSTRTWISRSIVVAALAVLAVAPSTASAAQEAPSLDPQGCVLVNLNSAIPTGAARRFDGFGPGRSAPFTLEGGAYRVEWTSTGPVEGVNALDLRSADSDDFSRVRSLVPFGSGNGALGGNTFMYTVKPGAYYLDARLPRGWTVVLTPIAV